MKLHLPLHFVSSSSHSFTSHHVSIFKCQERLYKISQKDPMNNDGCAHIFLQRLFFTLEIYPKLASYLFWRLGAVI